MEAFDNRILISNAEDIIIIDFLNHLTSNCHFTSPYPVHRSLHQLPPPLIVIFLFGYQFRPRLLGGHLPFIFSWIISFSILPNIMVWPKNLNVHVYSSDSNRSQSLNFFITIHSIFFFTRGISNMSFRKHLRIYYLRCIYFSTAWLQINRIKIGHVRIYVRKMVLQK